jgi:hypothetical protein
VDAVPEEQGIPHLQADAGVTGVLPANRHLQTAGMLFCIG